MTGCSSETRSELVERRRKLIRVDHDTIDDGGRLGRHLDLASYNAGGPRVECLVRKRVDAVGPLADYMLTVHPMLELDDIKDYVIILAGYFVHQVGGLDHGGHCSHALFEAAVRKVKRWETIYWNQAFPDHALIDAHVPMTFDTINALFHIQRDRRLKDLSMTATRMLNVGAKAFVWHDVVVGCHRALREIRELIVMGTGSLYTERNRWQLPKIERALDQLEHYARRDPPGLDSLRTAMKGMVKRRSIA